MMMVNNEGATVMIDYDKRTSVMMAVMKRSGVLTSLYMIKIQRTFKDISSAFKKKKSWIFFFKPAFKLLIQNNSLSESPKSEVLMKVE